MKKPVGAFVIVFLLTAVESYTRKDCVCGLENIENRLRNPFNSKYAWIVALSTLQGEIFCSGALISDQLVLTAGSCIINEYLKLNLN